VALAPDKFGDHCGVFGIFGHPEAAKITYLGLHALQHRGQESAGIVTSDGRRLYAHRGLGLVADVFNQEVLERLPGHHAIGHVRYSTAGGSGLANAQPLRFDYVRGSLALAHNGNLVDAAARRAELERSGAIFQTTTDTEVIAHLVARSQEDPLAARIRDSLSQVTGAYSLLFLAQEALCAARDPWGFRPLVLGRLDGADVVASETCALNLIDAEYLREIEPGEIWLRTEQETRSGHLPQGAAPNHCIFELVYFARPDSIVFGRNVYEVRKELGRALAREHPVPADIVVPVPDSGTAAALGYAQEAGLPFEMALIRSHYVGRTFIEPTQSIRHFGVKLKLGSVRGAVAGKRIVLVDDSLVRGTTAQKIVKMIRDAGAREVHLRIGSPPTTHPCYYGIDTPTREELIASRSDAETIQRFIECDSLAYLSLAGLHAAAGDRPGAGGFCNACFSGVYSAGEPPSRASGGEGPLVPPPRGLRPR
jgi:amidophosphoribosyltransferase